MLGSDHSSYGCLVDTAPSTVSADSIRRVLRIALVVDAVLWLAAGAASVNRALYSDDDWEGPYKLFSVLVVVAAAATSLSITMYTSKPNARSASRIAAVALAVLATVSTLVAWAFVVWSALLAAAFAALAGTGPSQRRHALWLAAPFLAGLTIAFVAAIAKLGPPGSHNDHSEAQGWGVTVACVLAAAVLAMLARRSSGRPTTVR